MLRFKLQAVYRTKKGAFILTKKNQDLFRKEALEHYAVHNQLNERLNIVSKFSSLILAAVGLALVTILVWGIWGTIPTRVSGEGILLATQGGLYNAVAPEGKGRISSIVVKPGDVVKKADLIAHMDDPSLDEKIKVAQSYLSKLEETYQKLNQQYLAELKQHTDKMNEEIVTLNKIIATNTEKLQYFTNFLETKKIAFKKGLITQDNVAVTAQNVFDTKDAINNASNAIKDIQVKQDQFVSQWQERLKTLQLRLYEQEYQVNDLKAQALADKKVSSPIAGVVTFIQASIGQKMEGGQVVATIATLANDLDALVYVPAQNGKRIKVGMKALVSPTTIKREEFGSIRATVVQVSLFPSNSQAIETVLQNEELVKEFTKQGAIIGIRLHLQTDPNTYSGYAWTSSKGPEQKISAGTLVKALITVKKQAPITLVVPALKKLLGE